MNANLTWSGTGSTAHLSDGGGMLPVAVPAFPGARRTKGGVREGVVVDPGSAIVSAGEAIVSNRGGIIGMRGDIVGMRGGNTHRDPLNAAQRKAFGLQANRPLND